MALISYDKLDRKKARYATSAGLAPVAQYPPNEFDLHDMAGSVTEWCSDWFERTCYESSPQATPKAHQRAFTEWCATALGRMGGTASPFLPELGATHQRTPNLGFRCVRDVE